MKKIFFRAHQVNSLAKFIFVKMFSFTFVDKYKEYWLISERGDEARDNGYAFYKYLKKEHPEINVKYVITKDSPDLNKIKKEDIVYLNSLKHHMLYISSSALISTHLYGFSPELRIFRRLSRTCSFLNGRGKKIFLQHGITQSNIPELYYDNTKLDLFIAGAYPEYLYIKDNFGYPDSVLRYTGFARYDFLSNSKSNYLLYMPTWRKELFHIDSYEKFVKTGYYKRINDVLSDKLLNKILEKYGLKLVFYPHYEIQKFAESFNGNNNIIIASSDTYDISQLLKECKMLITDYSSVFFDVAYLKKPIVYYQYDYDTYKKSHYMEGYFNFDTDGFGPVANTQPSLVEYVEDNIKTNFKVSDKYLKRINNTFRYNDNDNCRRIYNEIIKKQQ